MSATPRLRELASAMVMPWDVHVVSLKGARPAMEDTYAVVQRDGWVAGAIFDGHNGAQVSDFARERFAECGDALAGHRPGEVLRAIHRETRDLDGGACAVAFRLDRDANRLHVANVGDAELLAIGTDGLGDRVLTELHRLSNDAECARVLAAGAIVGHGFDGTPSYAVHPRLMRGLQVTRALGDHEFAEVGIVCEPHETTATFYAGWIVAACDGVWEVVKAAEVPELVCGWRTAELAARSLALEAFGRGTTDNVTVLVVRVP